MLTTITNKKIKGKIQFYFKNMVMRPDAGTVVMTEEDLITVSRDEDGQLFDFKLTNKHWLLKNALNDTNPLYGTHFVFEE